MKVEPRDLLMKEPSLDRRNFGSKLELELLINDKQRMKGFRMIEEFTNSDGSLRHNSGIPWTACRMEFT
jgi:hypothetical protein